MTCEGKKFIVVGGGIGGLAAAVALSQQGVQVTVLEQAAELGEIGAGVQLGPNAFAALDALGVGENAGLAAGRGNRTAPQRPGACTQSCSAGSSAGTR